MGLIDRIRSGVSNAAQTTARAATNVANTTARVATNVANTTARVATNVANTTANVATAAGRQVRDGFDTVRSTAGTVVGAINPFARSADSRNDGMLVGRGGQTFPPNTPLSQVPGYQPAGGVRNNETIIYTNGIQTDVAGQAASLQGIADTTGSRVVGVHNATDGFAADLRQCIQDKTDLGRNPAVDTLANTVYNELQAGRSVHLMGHSQGGLITSRALEHVQQRLRTEGGMTRAQAEQAMSNIRVETFGAAAGHYPDGPQYVHYINRADPVPTMFGLGQVSDRFDPRVDGGRGNREVFFTEPHLNPINAHSFDSVYLNRRMPFDQARAQ